MIIRTREEAAEMCEREFAQRGKKLEHELNKLRKEAQSIERNHKAAMLRQRRWQDRNPIKHLMVFVGPGLIILILLLGSVAMDPGRGPASVKPVIPAKPVKHVPAKPSEPEPTLEADEPFDYQGLELS